MLTFVGRVDNIVDLQRVRGLTSTEARQIGSLAGSVHAFYEVCWSVPEPTWSARHCSRSTSARATTRR